MFDNAQMYVKNEDIKSSAASKTSNAVRGFMKNNGGNCHNHHAWQWLVIAVFVLSTQIDAAAHPLV